ncbi:CoA transferase [Paraburkholderia sp. Ac-20340]|uniref:CaiB/BaiF CoA transferase family protein n=1 Tax=Paraburkholderia sp. Ac-20340 TaxID=2703888 RepID=UPI0019818675|nr:CoA transferase [Paraburkholderia sp. Ac-20340]MBN3858918.1 CoA transferase [Paraburkholderia sp. Ac-20340]
MQLDGVRIIDLTRIISGPFCTMLLADMGADVIKVEPLAGDPIREQGDKVEGISWYYASFNRNKRSIILDFRSAEGMQQIEELLRGADVVVENFRPGVMAKMGLGWERLQEISPGIIHTSINGFGTSGPYASRPAFDFIAQAMSGFMTMNGTDDTGPMRTALPISDLVAGNYAALGTVAALYRRRETGKGEQVSASLLGSLLSYGAFVSANYLASGEQMDPSGNDHPLVAPYGLFNANDGVIAIAPSNDGVLVKFLRVLGLESIMQDPRFATNSARVLRRTEVNALVNEVISRKPRAHWIEILNEAGVPCGNLMGLEEAYQDPQVLHEEMILTVEHPGHGQVKMLGFPIKFRNEPCTIRRPAPLLGGDAEEILGESDAELSENEAMRISTGLMR